MVQIELPTAVEAKLRERAAEQGQDVSVCAARIIEQALAKPNMEAMLAEVHAKFSAGSLTDDALGELLEAEKHAARQTRNARE